MADEPSLATAVDVVDAPAMLDRKVEIIGNEGIAAAQYGGRTH